MGSAAGAAKARARKKALSYLPPEQRQREKERLIEQRKREKAARKGKPKVISKFDNRLYRAKKGDRGKKRFYTVGYTIHTKDPVTGAESEIKGTWRGYGSRSRKHAARGILGKEKKLDSGSVKRKKNGEMDIDMKFSAYSP